MADTTQNKKRKRNKRNKKSSIIKKIFLTFLILFITVSVIGAGYVFALIKSTPDLDVNSVLNLNEPSRLYDKDSNFMDNVQTEEQRTVVPIDQISKNLQNAFTSIEDERFYEHHGIDIKRILGAAFTDAKNIFSGKSGLHGASTITQQLLKNTVLTNEISIQRKVKEIYLALELEKKLPKQKILEAYLNTIPLGGHSYGVEAASLKYFSKHANDLNLLESAYLAGVTQSPTLYNALTEKSKKNPTPYLNRTKLVLSKMKEHNKITNEEYNTAISDIDNKKLTFNPSKISDLLNFEWFSRASIDQVKKDLKAKYKYSDEEVNKQIMNGGLKIYTTMDRNLQKSTQDILNDPKNYVALNSKKNETLKEGTYSYPKLQASAAITDYKAGEVKALVGGRGVQPPGSLNRAYSMLRPIGSTTKPLTVYAPAIDMQVMTPATIKDDSPVEGAYNPKNEDNRYMGSMTLRDALKYSRNTIAVKVENEIGVKNGVSYGKKFGLIYNDASKSSIATASLGQFDGSGDGSNAMYMSAAFGTFGNNGLYNEPKLYSKVIDGTGKVILENKPEEIKVISPETSFILYNMLKEPINYTSGAAKFGSIPVSGKTGTTSDNKDLWFAGLTPYLSAAVWIGCDNPADVGGHSGMVVAPIWGKIMEKAHSGLQTKELTAPSGLVNVNVCRQTGKLPTDACKSANDVVSEWFIEGSEPSSYCDRHVSYRKEQEQTPPEVNPKEDAVELKDDEENTDKIQTDDSTQQPNTNTQNNSNPSTQTIIPNGTQKSPTTNTPPKPTPKPNTGGSKSTGTIH